MRIPALLVLLFAALLPAAETAPAIEQDIVYQHVGGRDLRLDLAPAIGGRRPAPVLLWVHGGGWRAGSRKDNHEGLRGFAKLGFAGVSLEYRLSGEARHPAQLEDIAAALRWIAAEAPARGLDVQRVGLVGGSAGGHLVLLAGFHGQVPTGMRIRAILNMAGPTSLSFALSLPSGDAALRQGGGMDSAQLIAALLGSADRADRVYGEASPLTWVGRDVPPVLTMQGRDDDIVPPMHAQALHAALRAHGVSERLILSDGGHDLASWPEAQRSLAFMSAIGFLAEHMR